MVLSVVACGGSNSTPTPSAPTSVNEPPVKGVARGQVLCAPCPAGTVIADAVVTVLDGAGDGTTTTTDQQGRYSLQVPVGTFRLRFTHQLYRTQDTITLTMTTQGLAVQTIALSPKPWTAFGVVTDGSGAPVSGAKVSTIGFVRGVPVPSSIGALSDTAGRYSLVFTESESSVSLVAMKDGYEPGSVVRTMKCCSDLPDSVNVNLRLGAKILSLRLIGPTSLRVGDTFTPRGLATLDDGRTIDREVTPEISDTRVVRYGPRGLEAMYPGAATLTWWYPGPYYWCERCSGRATLQVVVTSD